MNQEEKNSRLVNGITIVFIANVLSTFFNVALNFLLPRYLAVDAYAGIKSYELYYTFVSVSTLGYIDGVYLEYGGANILKINQIDIAIRINTLRWFQLVVMVLLFPVSLILSDDVFFFFVLSVPSLNIINLFQLLYQATGEYSRYSRILNVITISKTITSIVLLFFVTRIDYKYYLLAYVIISFGISIWQEYLIRKKYIGKQPIFRSSFSLMVKEIKDGFVLRVGVLSGFLLSGMDRIFVKLLMNTGAFALYSFAATVENILSVMITPVTTTMYNYFCDKPDSTLIRKIRNVIVFSSLCILIVFFPVKVVLSLFIRNYIDARIVLALLFASKSLYMVIQGVYVNLYKARKKQNAYLLKLIIVIVIGLLSNFVFYQIQPIKESFAVATFFSSIIWLIISALDFKDIAFEKKEISYYSLSLVSFLLCSCMLDAIIGMAVYTLLLLVLTRLMMFEELKILLKYIRRRIKKKPLKDINYD